MIRIKASPGYLAIILLITLFALRSPVYAASPDLTVSSIWLEKASVLGVPVAGNDLAPNELFNIVANITNLGQTTASGYYLDVYYDTNYGRGGPDNIAPGEIQQWFVGPLTAVTGAHTTQWVVDPDNQIAELNEQNNQKQYSFTIGHQIVVTNSTATTSSDSTMIVATTSTVTSGYTTTVTATTSAGTISTVTLANGSATVTSTTTTTTSPPTGTSSNTASQTITVTQPQTPTTVTSSVTVTQAVTQTQTVTQVLSTSNSVSSSTTSSSSTTVSSSSTSSSSSKTVSTTSSKTTSTTSQTTSRPKARVRDEIYYLLPAQDASSWWNSTLLLIFGAWLVLRLPHYVTGGLSASRFAKLSGRSTSKP